ncbi:hypothetical protein ACFWIZ_42910, partial [Streptomyces sp. NPDC127044]
MSRATAPRGRAAQPAGSGEAVGGDLAAYRGVQEASTNTVKHTVGAKATVTVEYGIDVVAEAADGAEAVEAVRRTRPDVVLMDILTTFDLDDLVYAALSAGANGFLLKDVTPAH